MSTPSLNFPRRKLTTLKLWLPPISRIPCRTIRCICLYRRAQKGKDSIGFARDDQGDSISSANPYLSELTALYWAWKNLDESCDAFGLAHYRRHFKGDAPIRL